jgi:hypothetical protein
MYWESWKRRFNSFWCVLQPWALKLLTIKIFAIPIPATQLVANPTSSKIKDIKD